MNARIREIKRFFVIDKEQKKYIKADDISSASYRVKDIPDHRRTALRLKAALENETPVIQPFERIVFTRTNKDAPWIFDEKEWADITSKHHIHEKGNVFNVSPDYGKILSKGLIAVRNELGDTEHDESTRISIDAILALTARYKEEAERTGLKETAEALSHVPANPPRSFFEALQMLRILHYAMWCEGDYHNTLGRFDQYMLPYYKDISEDDALELIEEFFLACNRDSDLYVGMQQGDNGQSLVVGGVLPDGSNGYNKLSELVLKASAELRVIDPKINLRVDKNTPLSVYELGTQLTKLGLGFPQYENDDIVVKGLEKLGYKTEDARNYVVAACWEFIIPAVGMDIANIGAMPIANLTDKAIREVLPKAKSIDDILERVRELINAEAFKMAEEVKNLYVIPSPYMSIFFDVEKGHDISEGCRYNNYGFHGTGIANAADMLAAVEKLVINGDVEPETLIKAMDADFEGYEELRYRLMNCPKMGNDDDDADKYADELISCFAKALKPFKNERGGVFRAGTGAAMYYIWHAAELGATADGRKKGVPLPANFSPSLDVKLNGPVSLLKSFSKPDLSDAINGGPVTIEFHDTAFKNDEAITKVATLVKMFIDRGGHQLQLNTVNADVLRDAQAHPADYKNLIVRVWGWSGYFVELDKCYQDHIIRRVEHSL